jgi:uncharacterized membrane protein YsdA (DUF1294 family)
MARLNRQEAGRIVREGSRNRRPPFARMTLRGAVVVVFFIFLFMAFLFGRSGPMVPFFYLAMSFVTLVVYAADKRSARRGGWRVSERGLHFLELACGWPGALLAQGWFRHKTSKPGYGAVFWVAVGLNFAGLLWLMSRRMV